MRIQVLALLVLAGCLTNPDEGYPVDAVAQLGPGLLDRPRVTGRIELLGTGMPVDVELTAQRTFAAYHVHVSDDLTHAVSLVSAVSCTEPPVGAPDRFPFQYLGVIRDLGDGAHFFMPGVEIGDDIIEVDTETATGYASRDDLSKRIVIVSEGATGGAPLACGVLSWR
ncbi:MAG TPA: hypothetical protein VLM79_40620 [Kofleriaceae bacterium]|nr:hypothetical protein [Kofleriaceae bacterium]